MEHHFKINDNVTWIPALTISKGKPPKHAPQFRLLSGFIVDERINKKGITEFQVYIHKVSGPVMDNFREKIWISQTELQQCAGREEDHLKPKTPTMIMVKLQQNKFHKKLLEATRKPSPSRSQHKPS